MTSTAPRPAACDPKAIVFVVDDDEDLLRSVEQLLEDEGYLVLAARNGVEALSRMRGVSGPTVAVVDLMMPEMDGRELLAAMKADPHLASIPVIVITAHALGAVEGATVLLRKPLRSELLLQAVEDSLGR